MIKPPAMGVFARDPPSNARAGAPSSAAPNANAVTSAAAATGATTTFAAAPPSPSALQPQPLPFDSRIDARHTGFTAQASDGTAEDAADVDDEGAAQDDDDQGTVDEEAGIIRCICGCDDDDGFTIQCDRCLVWQHCACFGMSQASVPDEYLCEQCEPRPVDVAFAQAHQQKRKNNEARKALMDRNLKRQAQAMASNNFNQAYLAPEPAPSPTSSHPLSSSTAAFATDDASAPLSPTITAVASSSASSSTAAAVAAAAARSRKPSHALDLTNTQFVVPEVPASAGASSQRGGKQRKGQKGSRRGYDTPSAVSTPVRGVFTPGSAHERADDPFDAAEQLEAWHVEFTPIAKNVVADPNIIPDLAAAMLDWEDGSPLKAVPGPAGRVLVPSLGSSSIASSSRHLASAKPSRVDLHASSSSASSPSPASPRASASPAEFESSPLGISAVGDECIPIELTGPSLADLACRTYVKQISESASAGVFSNLLYATNSADEPQRAWCASRAFSRPVMHGLFAEASIPAGAFISELRGELYSATAYRNDPINQYAALGATKPHVHLLPPPLNLAIDARRFGSEARFARFSCRPNAVLRPILFRPNGQPSARSRTSSRAQSPSPAALLARQHRYADTPPAESRSDEPQLLFGLFALTDIPRTHEITLGWEWDDAHIVHFLPELVQNPYLESRQDDVDPSQHTANMVALAEKGEFPYADTEFSVKMSTVSAALLGCVLCACIGSAAPPGGGGGASSNNGRKQDCAVAQMLRVGNGMSLLNVTMPGKTNRSRARLPDFSPLVGARRFWRPYSLPPTPEVSLKDEDSPAEAALLGAHSSDAEADMARLLDQEGEAGCGGIESGEAGSKARRKSRAKHADDAMDLDDDDRSAASDVDDTDDARSVASSLTDPLSGLSDQETLSEGDDEELMDALRQVDGVRAKSRTKKGGMRKDAADADAELSGLFLLPPKKRSMRTRIKASMAPSDEEDAGDEHDDDQEQEAKTKSRKSDVADKSKSAAKRKGANRHAVDFSSDEDRDSDGYSATTPVKKRRKSGNVADPSSPLSSVPSPGSIDSSLSTPPPVPRLSAKHKLENERRLSDRELLKKKRSAKQARDRKAKSSDSRPKESASRRRKREEARIHRNAILDLGDTESSEEDLTDRDDAESSNKATARDDASERGSAASTPRASKVALPAESAQVPREAKSKKAAAVESPKSAAKDTPSKTKKVRRILSDSEQSSDDEGKTAASSPSVHAKALPQVKDEEAAAQPTATAQAVADAPMPDADAAAPLGSPATATKEEGSEAKDAQPGPAPAASEVAPAPAAAPTPVPEVKKEEPRVKLSLAEYKRRLAERRVSEQQPASTSSASTAAAPVPVIATPTSEVAPSPSPAVEKVDPVRALPSVSSEPPTSEAVSAPAQPTTAPVEPRSPEKSASALPRGVLFTSIAAPTAIRSVEIPKSPSPEPPSLASAQQPSQVGAVAGGAAASSEASATTSAEVSAAAGAGVDATRARAPSVTQQPVGQNTDTAGANLAASEGSVKPQTPGVVATTPGAGSSSTGTAAVAPSAAAPTPSPTLGPTRYPGSRVPSSPSGPSTFNPPKAPRAFMSPPGVSAPAPLTSGSAAPPSTSAAAASASITTSASAGVASTPARSVAGVGNTPSTASSSSTASSRYPAAGLTSPTPNTTALPGYAPRAFAGVPKGPASMRDPDPRADAWAEAREAREAREYPGARHLDTIRDGGRDMGWGERPREPVGDRDGPRGGWGRERRDMMHRGEPMGREPYARDGRFFGRDERDGAGAAAVPPAGSGGAGGAAASAGSGALGSRIDHAHAHAPYAPYRRPSASEYDELHAGVGATGYDPYNRGIVVRGRSLGLGGPGASAGPSGPPGASGAGAREGRGEYRDYDDMGPGGGGQQGPPMGAAARGMPGFRSGWGGRSRPRGAPGGGGGRGRGWMR